MGYDVKHNQKLIKFTPGPGDYDTVPSDANSVIKKTFNYALNNGGLKYSAMTPKELLMVKTFGAVGVDDNGDPELASSAKPNDIIKKNIMAVKNSSLLQTHSTSVFEKRGNETISDTMTHSLTTYSRIDRPLKNATGNMRGISNPKGVKMSKMLPSLIDSDTARGGWAQQPNKGGRKKNRRAAA